MQVITSARAREGEQAQGDCCMELGTGIFLSAIFLGAVALFIATKDRWNWKKILLWPLGVIVGLLVVGWAAAYVYDQYEARPKKVDELWGIKLGASVADVKFSKGEPTQAALQPAYIGRYTRLLAEEDEFKSRLRAEKKAQEPAPQEKANDRKDENIWVYLHAQYADYYINFKNGKVRYVAYYGEKSYAPTISKINPYSTLGELEEELGQASHVSRSKDELDRIYSFERFNIFAHFRKSEIIGFGIYDPSAGPPLEIEERSAWMSAPLVDDVQSPQANIGTKAGIQKK